MCLQMHEIPRLKGVSGNPMMTYRHAEEDVETGGGVYKVALVVSARRARSNFIIGADFLTTHNCDPSLCQKLFTIGE